MSVAGEKVRGAPPKGGQRLTFTFPLVPLARVRERQKAHGRHGGPVGW